MIAVKIELSRLSGAAQRIEARQLQSGGVGPEPASAAATALDGKKHGKKAPVSAPEKVAAQGPDLSVSDKAMAAIQETQNIDAAAHGPAKAAEPKPPAPAAEIPAPAEAKTARAEPAQTAPPASVPAGNPGFGLQLGAYASSERAIAAWNGLKDQGGKLLADLLPKHEAVTVGDKTMYRLKAGPLPDEGAAQARCAELKAQSIQCLVAPFSGEWPSS
jgi:cell division septation protein DedD